MNNGNGPGPHANVLESRTGNREFIWSGPIQNSTTKYSSYNYKIPTTCRGQRTYKSLSGLEIDRYGRVDIDRYGMTMAE